MADFCYPTLGGMILKAALTGDLPYRDEIEKARLFDDGSDPFFISESWQIRDDFVRTHSFAIPCQEAISAIIGGGSAPILEVGAGTGLWAKFIADYGGRVVATDPTIAGNLSPYSQRVGRYYPVETLQADEAVKAYPDHDLLSVWPCLYADWIVEAARVLKPGRRIILVGELHGASNNPALVEFLTERCDLQRQLSIPTFDMLHDCLYIWRVR